MERFLLFCWEYLSLSTNQLGNNPLTFLLMKENQMSKLRILFAIPCLAFSMALVGCGGSESTFTPIEDAEAPDESAYEENEGDPYGAGGAAAPAGGASDS